MHRAFKWPIVSVARLRKSMWSGQSIPNLRFIKFGDLVGRLKTETHIQVLV